MSRSLSQAVAGPYPFKPQVPRRSRAPRGWRQTVIGIIATAIGAVAVLYLTTKTSHGASATTIAEALILIVPVWMFATKNVERALAIVLLYLGLFDGFIRLKTGSSNVTLARDIFLYAVVFGVLIRHVARGERWHRPPLTVWIVGWTAFVLVQLLNPWSGPVLHRIVSIRQDLEFVPLFFLGYAYVQSRANLRKLLILLVFIAAVNGAVGLYQSTLSPSQLASWGTGYYSMIKGTNHAPSTAVGANGQQIVRPPALGGDMGFGGALGMIALPGGVALLLTTDRRRRWGAVALGGMVVFVTLGVLTSQARSSVISAIVGMLAFAALLAASGQGKRVLVGLLAFGVVIGIALSTLSGGALHRYNTITPSKLASTVTSSRDGTTSLIPKYIKRFPFGAGIGSSGPAYGNQGSASNTIDGESQLTFLIGEVGVPGLVLFVAFQARALGGFVRRLRKVPDLETRILLAGLLAALFALVANWYVGINTTSPPNAPFMWGAIGVLSFWLLSGRARTDSAP